MILYLTDAEHLEELATLREEIHVKQIGNQDMQVLFQQELKHLSTVTHLIVEEAAIRNDTWEAAAASMRVMRNIPVLLIVENEGMTDTFIRKENYDVINRCRRDIQEIVRAWIQQADDMESLNHTWIAVAGLTSGAGPFHASGCTYPETESGSIRNGAWGCIPMPGNALRMG